LEATDLLREYVLFKDRFMCDKTNDRVKY